MKTRQWVALPALAAAFAVAAEDGGTDEGLPERHEHEHELEVIHVFAHPLSGEGLSQAAIVVQGEDLDRSAASSLGATLEDHAGVRSASFGQAVGRPIVHGLGGARVRVMEDRIDTMDVSVTSADHPTTVDPFVAERIEVLKGPSTLLYGSGAIGGVVDVHTGRIPHEARDEVTGRAEVRAADNGGRRTGAFRLDGGRGGFAWHVDGFSRDADEYDIPGFTESERLRALEEAEEEHEEEGHGEEDHAEEEEDHDEDEHEDEHEEEEEVFGHVPGSQLEMSGGSVGASVIGERGFVGVAVSVNRALFGIPGGHEHGHHDEHDEHEEEGHHDEEEGAEEEEEEHHDDEDEHGEEEEGTPVIDLEQTRIDFEAALEDPLPGFSALNFRFGLNEYEHVELEPNGEAGTVFTNDAHEGRVELVSDGAQRDSVVGFQFASRDFSVVGEEAFVPPVSTGSFGAFWLGEFAFDTFHLETGLRLGRVGHDPSGGTSSDFTTWAGSVGFVIPVNGAIDLAFIGDLAARAPISEELYSDGPHFATQSFEVGDSSLGEERAASLSGTFSYRTSALALRATAYHSSFADFIYKAATGAEEDGLPVLLYLQDDAVLAGLDLEADLTAIEFDGGDAHVRLMYDFVSANLDAPGSGQLPRLPPSRVGLGLDVNWQTVRASVDYRRVAEQDDVADNELVTDAWTDLRAFIGIRAPVGNIPFELFLQGRNLTDEEQRPHTSSIKDLAPLPGRTVEIGVRVSI